MNSINTDRIGEIVRFGIVGVIATAINYFTFILLFDYLGSNLSYTLGYVLSLGFNFILSNYFTFKTNTTRVKIIKFILAHGFNYLLQIVLLNIFIYIGINNMISPLFVYCISIPINFLLVRRALRQ